MNTTEKKKPEVLIGGNRNISRKHTYVSSFGKACKSKIHKEYNYTKEQEEEYNGKVDFIVNAALNNELDPFKAVERLVMLYNQQYKRAESKGSFIDRLRTNYPYHIRIGEQDGFIVGIDPTKGRPIYRLDIEGDKIIDFASVEHEIIEW